jgi:hypothetical protein
MLARVVFYQDVHCPARQALIESKWNLKRSSTLCNLKRFFRFWYHNPSAPVKGSPRFYRAKRVADCFHIRNWQAKKRTLRGVITRSVLISIIGNLADLAVSALDP